MLGRIDLEQDFHSRDPRLVIFGDVDEQDSNGAAKQKAAPL